MRVRVYYYNVSQEGNLLGSVKCETATQAKNIAAAKLGVSPDSLSTKRVSSSEAAAPVESSKKTEEKTTQEEKEPSTGDTSPKRQITVDFSKSSANEGQPTEKQAEAYEQLRHDVPIWDDAVPGSLQTIWKVTEEGVMIVKTRVTTKSGMLRKRKLVIRRGGAIHGYGKKPRGTTKLMTAKKDVMKYCYEDTTNLFTMS